MVQFHPARTYEDFVVGLYPRIAGDQLAFEVRLGDLLRANKSANGHPHLLVIDEINRADLGRVLGEAVSLFEPGEPDRAVRLPHVPDGYPESLQLSPNLLVLGTRNTADRSIARIDLAIRRRFAFIDVWPSLQVVQDQNDALATQVFQDILDTFTEWADDDALRLVPGHAYFLDPRPDLTDDNRPTRLRRRLSQELLPLLRDYVSERLLGPATLEVAGLADRIEGFIDEAWLASGTDLPRQSPSRSSDPSAGRAPTAANDRRGSIRANHGVARPSPGGTLDRPIPQRESRRDRAPWSPSRGAHRPGLAHAVAADRTYRCGPACRAREPSCRRGCPGHAPISLERVR